VGTLLLHHSGKVDHDEYRGSSALGACVELGFKLAREKDDDDRDRRYLDNWKCRPAPEPQRRWLRLSVERRRVYVDEAEPPDGSEPDRGGRPPVVREGLRPLVAAALKDEPQSRADVAPRGRPTPEGPKRWAGAGRARGRAHRGEGRSRDAACLEARPKVAKPRPP
jgi:hypothetical protein